jgi:hypothetical protein
MRDVCSQEELSRPSIWQHYAKGHGAMLLYNSTMIFGAMLFALPRALISGGDCSCWEHTQKDALGKCSPPIESTQPRPLLPDGSKKPHIACYRTE